MSENRMFFALTGDLEWICDYLRFNDFPFQFDHIMGEGFYRTFLTLKEYEIMKNMAEKTNMDVTYMGISDICHSKHHMFKNIITGFRKFLSK